MQTYDLLVIGAGPGGYVCAIKGAQLGLKTAIVEKDAYLGGTCLNVGCIPSKSLLHSTEMYAFLRHHAADHGIQSENPSIDLAGLMKKKDSAVASLRKGVQGLIRKNKIELIKGKGRLVGQGGVEVKNQATTELVKARHIVIATGSKPVELPFLPFDGKQIISSDQAIALNKVPERLTVVGGGAIGLELGSVWSRLGSQVTLVEFLPRIAAGFDIGITQAATRIFKRQGLRIETETKVKGIENTKTGAFLIAEQKGKNLQFEAGTVLVAVGRKPNTEGLGLESLGIELNSRGHILTNDGFQTNVDGIYAIGDVTTGPMLAHKAEEEGVALAHKLANRYGHVDYRLIPNVIYTDPEIASVGFTEAEAKEAGYTFKTGQFSLAANGRALASGAGEGLVKIIADATTDRLLGVHIIAKSASELIASAVAHMQYGGSAEDLGMTVHAHPTLSESLKEAALDVHKAAIHC